MATTTTGAPTTTSGLAGVAVLVRFALRRDRVRLGLWVLAIAAGVVLVARSLPGIYPDAQARALRAALMQSPGAIAFGGPRIGVDDYTFGAMMTNEMLGLTSVLVALMSIFAVVRHTRSDEEAGRTELLRASVVGRHAPLAAALAVAFVANVAIAVVCAAGLGSLGVEGIGWAGSWLFGASLASVGVVFAGGAAVTSQVTDHARSATGLAGLALGVAYGLRAAGDVAGSPLAWLSPIGWAQRTYAYVDDRWWPVALAVGVTALLCAGAFVFSSHRDFGTGLRRSRPGASVASLRLASPYGLAFRLQRGALVAWIASFLGFGLVYGSLLGQGGVEGLSETSATARRVLAGIGGDDFMKAFQSLLATLLAMTAAIYAVVATLRARSEESSGRAESVLTLPLSRRTWITSHAAVAATGSVAAMIAGAIGVGISGAATTGEPRVLARMVAGSLVQVAPLLLVVAATVALYGLAPRAAGAIWIVVGYGLFAGLLGGLLGLPRWAQNLSPFALVPLLPAQSFRLWPLLWIGALAIALFAVGVWGLGRRDMHTGG